MDTVPSIIDALARFAAMVAPMEAQASKYEVPAPHERRDLMRCEAAELVDGLLLRVARGHGALDVALGKGLAALADSGGEVRLGFSGIGDLARERLGFSARTALDLAKVARGLRDRPLLEAAVLAGEVSISKAGSILAVARGEAEPTWVERARTETVRELAAAAKAALAMPAKGDPAAASPPAPVASGPDVANGSHPASGEVALDATSSATADAGAEDDERWAKLVVSLTPEQRAVVDEAVELAGRQIGHTKPRARKLEAICQEYLGSHPASENEAMAAAGCCGMEEPGDPFERSGDAMPGDPEVRDETISREPTSHGSTALDWTSIPWTGGEGGSPPTAPEPRRQRFESNDAACLWSGEGNVLDEIKASVERETCRWEFLARGEPVTSPTLASLADGHPDPFKVLAELEALAAMRDRWDTLLGHLGLIFTTCGLWREARFVSLRHYVTERLGMSPRTFEQRVALERSLYFLPALRDALAQGRLSYEKARLVARCPDTLALPGWIELAEKLTCVALRDTIEAEDERQMSARGELAVPLPDGVASVVREAFRAVREARDRSLSTSECLVVVCSEFIATWKESSKERNTVQLRVLRRDRHRCRIPGCSRAAMNVHHVHFRSHGGGDTEDNLASLCLVHHLRGVHQGLIRILKVGTNKLRFELGLRPDQPPLMVFEEEEVSAAARMAA